MIRIDLSKVKSLQKLDIFGMITDQLIDQAGSYGRRETIGTEPGDEVVMGDNLNIYADYKNLKVWILQKPEIDG